MSIVGYAYDADHHCESCMLDYARAVEYKDYVWETENAFIEEAVVQSYTDLMKAVELEIIRDGENNPIHPIFSIQEWYNIGEGNQTLCCSDCGKELDSYEES